MSALVQRKVHQLLISELISINAVTMVRIPAFWDISFEVLLVFLVVLGLNLLVLAEVLSTLASGTESNEQALESNGSRREHHIRVKFWQRNANIVKRHP